MNILILSQYFWPENFRINELTFELSKLKKLKVHVLTCNPSYPEKNLYSKKLKKFKDFSVKRVPVYLRDGSMFSKYLNYITFVLSATYYLLFVNKTKFDKIFVFQVSPVSSAIPAILYSSFCKCRIYLWVLDLWPESIKVFGFNSKILFFFMRKLSDFVYSRVDVLLAQSNSIKLILKERYSKKTLYFPNWSEDTKSTKVNYKFEKKVKVRIDKKKINIFFGGNLGKAQDIKNILKSIKITNLKNKNINWFFFGEGSEKHIVKNFIKSNGNPKNTFLFSTLPQTQFKYLVKKYADILLVCLADYETLKWTIPGKIQFYFQCKKPIIGMLNGESKKLIEKSKSGMVSKSGNHKNFSKMVVNNFKFFKTKKFKKKGLNGFEYSNKNFDKIKIMNRLNTILNI